MILGLRVVVQFILAGVGVNLTMVDGMTDGMPHGIMVIMVAIHITATIVAILIMVTMVVILTITAMMAMAGITHGADIMVDILTMATEEVATTLIMVILALLITGATLHELLALRQDQATIIMNDHLIQLAVAINMVITRHHAMI